MIEVELHTKKAYIDIDHPCMPERIYEVCKKLIKVAEDEGLTDCYLLFYSTNEPYEDYLGPVAIIPCGYREANVKEVLQETLEKEVESLATVLGVSIYEARVLHKHKDMLK